MAISVDNTYSLPHKYMASKAHCLLEKGTVHAVPFRYRVVNVKETNSFQPRTTMATIPRTLMALPPGYCLLEECLCLLGTRLLPQRPSLWSKIVHCLFLTPPAPSARIPMLSDIWSGEGSRKRLPFSYARPAATGKRGRAGHLARGPSPTGGSAPASRRSPRIPVKTQNPENFFRIFPNSRARQGYFRQVFAHVVHPHKALKSVAKVL
jgi:hypothetical protein